MPRLLAIAIGIAGAALLGGCGNLSNEDLRFLAILPDSRTLTVETPADEGQALCEDCGVGARKLALSTSGRLNGYLRTVLHALEVIPARPPTERDEGRRVWGPLKLPSGKGHVRLTMELDDTAACPGETEPLAAGRRYRWTLDAGKKPETLVPLFGGVLKGEAADESCGTLRFDVTAHKKLEDLAGDGVESVELGWTRDAGGLELTLDVQGSDARELVAGRQYRFRRNAEGFGSFRMARRENVHSERQPLAEKIELQLQWAPGGSPGRGDFRVSEGELVRDIRGSTCWNARGRRIFYEDDLGLGRRIADEPCDPQFLPAVFP